MLPGYLWRILRHSLLIGVVPVVVLGLLSYHQSTNALQKKVNEGNLQVLSQTQMSIEHLLMSVEHLTTQFISSGLTSSALNEVTSFRDADILRELSTELHRLQFVQFGITNATMVNLDYGWTMGNDGFIRLEETPEERQRFERYGERDEPAFWLKRDDKIMYVRKLPTVLNLKSPKGLLVLEMSYSRFADLVTKQNLIGEVVVLNSEFAPIAQGQAGAADAYPAIVDQLAAKLNGATSGHFLADKGRESYSVTFTKSTYNDWYYLSFSPAKDITTESRKIGMFTLYTSLLIIGLTAAFAYWTSGRVYLPIRKLYESVRKLSRQEQDEKADDEFSYIEDRLRRMFKNELVLEGELKQQQVQLNHYLVLRLFLRRISAGELQEKLPLLGIAPSWQWLTAIAVQIDTLDGTRYEKKDYDLLLFAISNIVGEILPANKRLDPITLDRSSATVLLSDTIPADDLHAEMEDWADKLKKHISNVLGVSVSIGISRPYRHLLHTPEAFGEAVSALHYRINLGADVILFIDEIEAREQPSALFPRQVEERLLDAVRNADRQEAARALHEFLTEVVARDPSPLEYQLAISELLSHVIELLHASGRTARQLFGVGTLLDHVREQGTVEEAANWLNREVLEPIMEVLDTERHAKSVNITESLMHMIRQEYKRDLQLEECAARLNFHPVYVSRVFKKETGYSFSDYLAGFRLRQAKDWLRNTDMKVADIAEQLNYQSSSTFIRYFRKMEGMTPGQFREEHQNSKE